MRAESMNCLLSALLVGLDRRAAAVLADALVFDLAGDEREERVVATDTNTGARRDPGAALANQDRARIDALAAVDLDAQHRRVPVPTVPRAASAFLVCHLFRFLLGAPARGPLRRFLSLRFPFGLSHGGCLLFCRRAPSPRRSLHATSRLSFLLGFLFALVLGL